MLSSCANVWEFLNWYSVPHQSMLSGKFLFANMRIMSLMQVQAQSRLNAKEFHLVSCGDH